MAEVDMAAFEARFEARLRAYADIPVALVDADVVAHVAAAESHHAAVARRAVGMRSRRAETGRALLIAAALAALLLAIVGLALLAGGRDRSLLLGDATATPPPTESTPPSETPISSGPADDRLRATWIANSPGVPLLGAGASPLSIVIAGDGTRLSVVNFPPGATLDSTISQLADGTMKLALDRPSGGCTTGDIGTYAIALNDDASQLALTSLGDACPTRAEVLSRAWGRSLGGPSNGGSGFVTSIVPAFSVALPGKVLSTRTQADMIEIEGEHGFSLMAFKNPQGFVDPCSTAEKRYPYTPGMDAFVAFLRQNPALDVVSVEHLTIDGEPAIHVVTVPKDEPACGNPPDGLYLWTPKNCDCHFGGGHDSLYLVDVRVIDEVVTTLMFEVSPVDEASAVERQVIDSLRIPALLPGP
jgi:hypothetical protein